MAWELVGAPRRATTRVPTQLRTTPAPTILRCVSCPYIVGARAAGMWGGGPLWSPVPCYWLGHPALVLAFENPHMAHFWKTHTLLKTASLPLALSPPTRKPISPEE